MLLKCCTQYVNKFEKQQRPQDWKRSVFIPIPKKGNAKECSNYHIIALISHTSKVLLKILQARLQQYVIFKMELAKVEEPELKLPTSIESTKKKRIPENIYFCFTDYHKAFDCVDHNKLWKILQELGLRDHLTGLLRNLYAGQEPTVRTRHGTTYWFQIGKGVLRAMYYHSAYYFFAEYNM